MKTQGVRAWLEASTARSDTLAVALARDLLFARETLHRLRTFGEQVRDQGDLMLAASDFAGAMLELPPPDDF